MRTPILVTYATRFGSTAEVAQRIVDVLQAQGEAVDLRLFSEVDSLEGYKAVVLGSAIRVGKWLPEAIEFLETHYSELSQRPTAFFTVCMTLRENTSDNRLTVSKYLTPVLDKFPDVRPVSFGMFAGKLDYAQAPLIMRLFLRVGKIPQGDWRNWEEIETWARSIRPLLNAETQLLQA